MGKLNDQLKNKQFRKAKKHDTDNGSVIEVAQDVTDIVEKNKQEYNQASTSWGNDVFDNKFTVNIISHTENNTTWKDIKEGDNINTEIDIFARYISRQIEEK